MERWLNTSDLQRAFDYVRMTSGDMPKILFVCPRQSGKTTALFKMFLETPGAVFLTPFGSSIRSLRAKAIREGTRQTLVPSQDILAMSNNDPIGRRQRTVSVLFIDEFDHFRGSYDAFLRSVYPYLSGPDPTNTTMRGIISATTPTRNMGIDFYNGYFNHVRFPFSDDGPELRREDFKKDHFEEGDLFEV